MPPQVRPFTETDEAALLALNNANAAETSTLDPSRLRTMTEAAFLTAQLGRSEAMLIAFDQDADYDSVHFLWFRERFGRFVYVDRIITAAQARGRGYARSLYAALFDRAAGAGHRRIVCEVNLLPPNPVSEHFHAALGFCEVGRTDPLHPGKQVRYLTLRLG